MALSTTILDEAKHGSEDVAHQEKVESLSTEGAGGDESEEEKPFKLDAKLVMAGLAILMGYEAAAFLLVLVAPIMSYINADLGPVPYYAWISISWSISNGIFIMVSGRMMDIWGRRYIMIFGNVLGLVGCIVAATAGSVGVVITGVTIGGVGAGIQQQGTACLGELVPRRYRPFSSAVVSAALVVSLFGTPIAYAFVDRLTWRWSFYCGIMANGLAVIGTVLFYFPPTFKQKHGSEGITKMQEFLRLDWVGLFLFIGSLLSLLLGISWGGSRYPWRSAGAIAPIVAGAVGIIGFGIWESLGPTPEPLLPLALIKNVRGFVMPMATVFVAGMLLYALSSYWPYQVAVMYSTSLSETGWMGMTVYGSTVVGSLILGSSIYRLGHSRLWCIGSTISMTAFIASMAAMTIDTRNAAIALSICGGLCIGFVSVLTTSIVLVCGDDQYIGTAIGLLGTARLVGGAIATAIYSSILSNKLTSVLPGNVANAVVPLGYPVSGLPALIGALMTGNSAALATLPGLSAGVLAAASTAVKVSYGQAFRLIYLVSLAFGGCAIVTASFVRGLEDQLTMDPAVKLNPAKPVAALRRHGEAHAEQSPA